MVCNDEEAFIIIHANSVQNVTVLSFNSILNGKKRSSFHWMLLTQVMMQPHNRRVSFSLYISALSITDTIALMLGMFFSVLWINGHGYCVWSFSWLLESTFPSLLLQIRCKTTKGGKWCRCGPLQTTGLGNRQNKFFRKNIFKN